MNDYEKLARAQELIAEVQQNLEPPTEPPTDFPIPADQLVWKNGNVWKGMSESDGKAVAVLRNDWPVPDKVEGLLNDGSWDEFIYTGSDANGNRHHFRGSVHGRGYRGKRKEGRVRVWIGQSYGEIFFPGPPRGEFR